MTNEYTGGSVSYYTVSVTHPINEQADPYDAECIDIIDALQMTPNEANAFKALWRRAAARLGKSKRGYVDGLYDAEKVEFYGRRLVELERRGRPEQLTVPGVEPVLDWDPEPLLRIKPADIIEATHRDAGGNLFKQHVDGRWLQFGLDSWFYASADPEAVPVGLRPIQAAVSAAAEALAPENQRVALQIHCCNCGAIWEKDHACAPGQPEGLGWRGAHLPWPRDMSQRVEVVYGSGRASVDIARRMDWDNVTWWRFDRSATDPFGPRDADGWYAWNGDDTMRPAGMVDFEMRIGGNDRVPAESARWTHEGVSTDIVKWRPAQPCASGT